TVNANGTLDLNNFNDMIGALTMAMGRSSGAIVQSGNGTLGLLGDITVSAGFQGSSGASNLANTDTGLASPPLIKGNLDLGGSFSGAGGTLQRTITVNDTALANPAADLVIAANISGAATVAFPQGMQWSKAGAGTLRLTGNNSYVGPTRLTAGIVEI